MAALFMLAAATTTVTVTPNVSGSLLLYATRLT